MLSLKFIPSLFYCLHVVFILMVKRWPSQFLGLHPRQEDAHFFSSRDSHKPHVAPQYLDADGLRDQCTYAGHTGYSTLEEKRSLRVKALV